MKKLLFLVLFIAAFATANSFCSHTETVQGNGVNVKKELTGLTDFDGIAAGVAADIVVTKGDVFKVEYEGDEKLLENIVIEVKNRSLSLENKKGWNWSSYKNNGKTVFRITMPSLKKIALDGSGDIVCKGDFNEDRISIALGGSGDVKMSGTARNQKVAIGGSGDVDLSELKGESGDVAIGGSGNVRVNVSEKLSVAIGGSGDVIYKGNPSVKKAISGSGDVRQD